MTRHETTPSDTIGTPAGTPDEPVDDWAIWTLYRYFDADDVLLYVGITSTGRRRGDQHNWNAQWWGSVVRATFTHYDSLGELEAAEVEAIQTEFPVYNWRHSGRGSGWYESSLENVRAWQEANPYHQVIDAAELAPLVGYQTKVLMAAMFERRLPFLWDQRDYATWGIRLPGIEEVIRGLTNEPPRGWPNDAVGQRMARLQVDREQRDREAVERLAAAIDGRTYDSRPAWLREFAP